MELEKIRKIIAEQMNLAPESITEQTSFADDLGADSLDIFQIISELEEEFGMEFSSDAAERIKTVGDAIEYIRSMS